VWNYSPVRRIYNFPEITVTADPNLPQGDGSTGSPANKLSPSGSASVTTLEAPPQPANPRFKGFELWLHRVTVLMFVFVCAIVGMLLIIIPWRPEWTDNRLLQAFPGFRAFMANGFVRGMCSGLGVLDIWIGFSEAVHYHEEKRL
jgi:hypothetical protein